MGMGPKKKKFGVNIFQYGRNYGGISSEWGASEVKGGAQGDTPLEKKKL